MRDIATDGSQSSPLSSPVTLPTMSILGTPSPDTNAASRNTNEATSRSPVHSTGLESPSDNIHAVLENQKYDCFTTLPNAEVHYYSALELYARGVWVGYLDPKRHRQPYRDLPSYYELKENFRNMILPHPPAEVGLASQNTMAVCRHCLPKEPKLVMLRRLKYDTNSWYLTIMPLDGEDGLKMFCIMLPQDLARSTKTLRQSRDRSTSHIQAWRPYEIETNSNIEIFKNSFMLLGLRNTKGVRGTLQIVRAILGLPDSTNVGKRTTNTYLPSGAHVHDVIPTIENEDAEEVRPNGDEPTSQRQKRTNTSVTTPNNRKRKRKRTCVVNSPEVQDLRELDVNKDGTEPTLPGLNLQQQGPAINPAENLQETLSSSLPNNSTQQTETQNFNTITPVRTTTTLPNFSKPQGTETTHPLATIVRSRIFAPTQSLAISQPVRTMEISPVNGLPGNKSREIHIMLSPVVNGEHRDLVMLVVDGESAKDVLAKIQQKAQSIPSAATILEKTATWRMTYSTPGGSSEPQVIRRGIERALDILVDDFAQPSFWTLQSIRVELKPIE